MRRFEAAPQAGDQLAEALFVTYYRAIVRPEAADERLTADDFRRADIEKAQQHEFLPCERGKHEPPINPHMSAGEVHVETFVWGGGGDVRQRCGHLRRGDAGLVLGGDAPQEVITQLQQSLGGTLSGGEQGRESVFLGCRLAQLFPAGDVSPAARREALVHQRAQGGIIPSFRLEGILAEAPFAEPVPEALLIARRRERCHLRPFCVEPMAKCWLLSAYHKLEVDASAVSNQKIIRVNDNRSVKR